MRLTFSRSYPYEMRLPCAPTLGMHNKEIFSKVLGLGEDDLTELEEQGVI